ncbi:MAG: carboxymuconolactone decarboxylase [Acidobacteria bacterium]|nr:MAG: carboxymuconolactone decarboxylase [Acidobacteriota bacterium]PIE89632.1 MAG: carboxymuconolactone decarboxylase [Acidobacteriota bacterium]
MKIPGSYQKFKKNHPDILKAYEAFNRSVREVGALSEREVHLVKLALSAGAQMEGTMGSHIRKALEAGVDEASLEQIALLAMPTIGFSPGMKAWRVVQKKGEK